MEEIIKIVATRCQILRLQCIKSSVGWGSAPDPVGGAYSAPPRLPSWMLGRLLLRGEGMGREGKGREEGEEREGEGKGGREGRRRGGIGEGRG